MLGGNLGSLLYGDVSVMLIILYQLTMFEVTSYKKNLNILIINVQSTYFLTDRFLSLNFHGKQLKLCRDGQLLNHTVPGQASQRQITSIKSPFSSVTDNLLFLISGRRKSM